MPWNRTDWMAERVKFIAAFLEYEASFTDLCRDFGVSRKAATSGCVATKTTARELWKRARGLRTLIRTPYRRLSFRRSSRFAAGTRDGGRASCEWSCDDGSRGSSFRLRARLVTF